MRRATCCSCNWAYTEHPGGPKAIHAAMGHESRERHATILSNLPPKPRPPRLVQPALDDQEG